MSIYRRRSRGKRSRYFTAEFEFRGKPYRRAGFVDRASAEHWVESERKRLRRGEVGYVKPMLAQQVAPLIAEYADYLRGKGRDDMYCYTAEKRLKRLAADCGWLTLGQVTTNSADRWMNEEHKYQGKPIGKVTKNQHADIAATFGQWLVKPKGLLPENPLAGIERFEVETNDSYRRSGTVEELDKLLAHSPAERQLFYRFLIYCPLRMDTVEHLEWGMMHLDATPPFILLPKEHNKSRKVEKSLLRYDVAQEFRNAKKKAKAKADDRVFDPFPTIDDWREDLKAAGIPFDVHGQHRFDRHALRRTLVWLCEASGVSEGMASKVLHHKDVRTTKRYYGINRADSLVADALEKLPPIGKIRRA